MAILNNSNAISSGGYDINNSLRFRSSASAYLSRAPASTTNRQIFTLSAWVKRGSLSTRQIIFCSANPTINTVSQQEFQVVFDSSDKIQMVGGVSGVGNDFELVTTQVFRDPSAWYHIVVAVDTTQATAANRIKLYVNGSQVTSFSTTTNPAQNYNTSVNLIVFSHRFGGSGTNYLDGYLAEVNFIDGQALTPSSFGETDTTTGSWKPKAYTGTYGTNGFELNFSDIATTSGSNAGLGKDFSGNGNYYNTTNISVTAGTTYDAMIDSPTLTSATVGNYAVMNPLKLGASQTLTQANLNVSGSGWGTTSSTLSVTTGKWYWEITSINSAGTASNPSFMIGVSTDTSNNQSSYNATGVYHMQDNGDRYYNNTTDTRISGVSIVTNDVVMLAYDADAGKLWIGKNGTWFNSGSPTGGTGQIYSSIPTTGVTPTAAASGAGAYNANFGQRPFSYTPPSGFVRLNTYNLPDSTIVKGNTVMDATLYTGTGSSLAVVNAAGFKPDLVYIANRVNAKNKPIFDSVRGVNQYLYTNSTSAELNIGGGLTAFNSNGFTVGGNSDTGDTVAMVGWQWQAGQGSTTTGTGTGGITSVTQSVNATAGFSIVTYTGSGANGTVTHGLGVAPKMVIVKSRSYAGTQWVVWHTGLTSGAYTVYLNLTNAQANAPTVWNSTIPTSTVFSVGTNADSNNSGSTYVAYCWAEIAGFSKFTSYTGNGSTDGPFVYLGFRPKFVMIKRTNTTEDWMIWDTSRSPYNAGIYRLYPNTSGAENSTDLFDILSNGFKCRDNDPVNNASGSTYIVAAWAENPFKNSNAR
jgi:hypothetical protein